MGFVSGLSFGEKTLASGNRAPNQHSSASLKFYCDTWMALAYCEYQTVHSVSVDQNSILRIGDGSKPWRSVAKGCRVLSEDSQLPQPSVQWHTNIGNASLARSCRNCFNKAISLFGIECPEDRLYQHRSQHSILQRTPNWNLPILAKLHFFLPFLPSLVLLVSFIWGEYFWKNSLMSSPDICGWL